jgi:hypothetical protein
MTNVKVRQRRDLQAAGKEGIEQYIKLVDRCPELVLQYSWTDEGDKEKARKISKLALIHKNCLEIDANPCAVEERKRQGTSVLPGSVIKCRSRQ